MRRSAFLARLQSRSALAMRLPVVSPQRSPFPPRRSEREFETRGGLLTMDGLIAGVGAAVTRKQVPHEVRVVDCKL